VTFNIVRAAQLATVPAGQRGREMAEGQPASQPNGREFRLRVSVSVAGRSIRKSSEIQRLHSPNQERHRPVPDANLRGEAPSDSTDKRRRRLQGSSPQPRPKQEVASDFSLARPAEGLIARRGGIARPDSATTINGTQVESIPSGEGFRTIRPMEIMFGVPAVYSWYKCRNINGLNIYRKNSRVAIQFDEHTTN
jgi:hypothetical protein